MNRQAIAESVLGAIEWIEPHGGFCRCPGFDLHTGANRHRDCRVSIDRAPTLNCFHSSCTNSVAEANRSLRSAIGKAERGAGIGPLALWRPSREERERRRQRLGLESLKKRAKLLIPTILAANATDPAQFQEASPVPIPENPTEHWREHLTHLFQSEDVIWCGDKFDSGRPEHAARFRTVREWLASVSVPGPLIVPATFRSGTYSRCKADVLARRFLVIESDTLSKPQTLAVFTWCRQFMRLRAIVDSAGKSLHGWFDARGLSEAALAQLRVVLPELGADPALFGEAQPCRLPGWQRSPGKFQRLLFLEGGRSDA